ncbi:MAG: hypothetical protein R3A78_06650 [Polyangiales bacterium]
MAEKPKDGEDVDAAEMTSRPWTERLVIVVVPVAVCLATYALFVAGAPPEGVDLKLRAPSGVEPGARIGLRALSLTGLDTPGNVETHRARVEVELRDPGGTSRARTTLTASRVDGAEGHLEVPTDVRGALTLAATAEIERTRARVVVPLEVRANAPAVLPVPRKSLALQRVERFPMERVSPTWHGGVRIAMLHGGCIPDLECDVFALSSDPKSRVELVPRMGLDPLGAPPEAAPVRHMLGPLARAEVDGSAPLALLHARLYGPEAEVEARVFLGDTLVATRVMRLAVVPGGIPFVVAAGADAAPCLRFPAALRGKAVVVDIFEAGHWRDASSIVVDPATCAPLAVKADTRDLTVQVSAEVFDAEMSLRAVVPHELDAPLDVWFDRLDSTVDVLPLPEGVGSYAQAAERVRERHEAVRTAAFLVYVLGAILACLVIVARSLRASREARSLLERAADASNSPAPVTSARHRVLAVLSLVVVLFAVVLGFAVGAILVMLQGAVLP